MKEFFRDEFAGSSEYEFILADSFDRASEALSQGKFHGVIFDLNAPGDKELFYRHLESVPFVEIVSA